MNITYCFIFDTKVFKMEKKKSVHTFSRYLLENLQKINLLQLFLPVIVNIWLFPSEIPSLLSLSVH